LVLLAPERRHCGPRALRRPDRPPQPALTYDRHSRKHPRSPERPSIDPRAAVPSPPTPSRSARNRSSSTRDLSSRALHRLSLENGCPVFSRCVVPNGRGRTVRGYDVATEQGVLLFRPPGTPARDTTTSYFRQKGAEGDDVSQPSEAGSMPGGTGRVRLAGELGDSQVSGGPSHGGGPLVPARASSTRRGSTRRWTGITSLCGEARRA
jgi:hypothetical protein